MRKINVAYVDDDRDDRLLVEDAFRNHTHVELLMFEDGVEFLHYLNTNKEVEFCLIILDINLPKLDGKDILRLLRSNSKFENVPVVLFTTSSLPADAYFARFYNAGFIVKPMDTHQMNRIIDVFLSLCAGEVKQMFISLS